MMAVWTGLEPATSCVTGRHSNQLNYQTLAVSFKTGCKDSFGIHLSKSELKNSCGPALLTPGTCNLQPLTQYLITLIPQYRIAVIPHCLFSSPRSA